MPVPVLQRAPARGCRTSASSTASASRRSVRWPPFCAPRSTRERPDSVGRSVLFVETRVVDPEMNDVAAGEVGEVVYRSPQLCSGYWGKPEETAEAFGGGWFHSGDLVPDRRRGLPVRRRPDQGRDQHRRRAGRLAARSKTRSTATTPWPRWRSSGCPTSAGSRRSRPSSCCPREAHADELIAFARERLAPTRCPSPSTSSTSCPRTPPASCSSASCARRSAAARAPSDRPAAAQQVEPCPPSASLRAMLIRRETVALAVQGTPGRPPVHPLHWPGSPTMLRQEIGVERTQALESVGCHFASLERGQALLRDSIRDLHRLRHDLAARDDVAEKPRVRELSCREATAGIEHLAQRAPRAS